MVDNVEKIRNAVPYAKYPPEGKRSQGGGQYGALWGRGYRGAANDNIMIIAMIESPAGAEIADEIAAVPGVDVVFAGPQDIAASMGVIGQPRHPDVVEILDGFPERVARFGKPAGITDVGYEHSARWRDRGYRFINIGTLTHLGMTGVSEAFEQLRNGESG